VEEESHRRMTWLELLSLVVYAVFTSIPVFIAIRRKCKNITLINLLSFYLSWTVIGWVVALVWALKDETESPTQVP
jgi:hypothetical protein